MNTTTSETDPHERDHESMNNLMHLWLNAKKGGRAEFRGAFRASAMAHLKNFHGWTLDDDASIYGLLCLHEGFHENDDVDA